MFTWLSILTVNFCIFSYISILFLLIALNSHIFYQNKFQIQNLYESIFIMVKFILVIIYYFIFNCTKTAELILTQHSILNSDHTSLFFVQKHHNFNLLFICADAFTSMSSICQSSRKISRYSWGEPILRKG